jgi:hypothetical protein
MGLPGTLPGPSLGLRSPDPGRVVGLFRGLESVSFAVFCFKRLGKLKGRSQVPEAKSRHRQAGGCCFVG